MKELIDYSEIVSELIDVVAVIFPEAYQKTKEAKLRDEMMRLLRDFLE